MLFIAKFCFTNINIKELGQSAQSNTVPFYLINSPVLLHVARFPWRNDKLIICHHSSLNDGLVANSKQDSIH